jgi:hypothetical protein
MLKLNLHILKKTVQNLELTITITQTINLV